MYLVKCIVVYMICMNACALVVYWCTWWSVLLCIWYVLMLVLWWCIDVLDEMYCCVYDMY